MNPNNLVTEHQLRPSTVENTDSFSGFMFGWWVVMESLIGGVVSTMWKLRVLPVPAWIFFGYSSFLLSPGTCWVLVLTTGDSIFPVGVSGRLSPCVHCVARPLDPCWCFQTSSCQCFLLTEMQAHYTSYTVHKVP